MLRATVARLYRLPVWRRLWQPGHPLFRHLLACDGLSSPRARLMRTLPLGDAALPMRWCGGAGERGLQAGARHLTRR